MKKLTATTVLALMLAPLLHAQIATDGTRLQLARQAVSYNTPREALMTGNSPLAGHPMFGQVVQRVDFNRVNEQAAQLMADTFTEAEIRALVNFFGSPEGQRISMKMPGYQKLVGSMVQNEMKAAFEGYVLSQGAQGGRAGNANGAAMQGIGGGTGFNPSSPLPMSPAPR